ncbi:MAG TPA: hypothetical protein VHO46_07195 [Bacteroidales bacterium]|nr:hypothetical protein [Bacteroidales bacterium]
METTRGVIKIKTYTESFSYYKDEKYKVRFSDHSGNTWENDAVYDIDKNRFIFSIPCENLQRETIYKFELVRLVSGQANSPILSWYFRTSKFDRFEDKLNTMTDVINTMGDINEYLWTPYFIFNLGESFDIADGKPYSGLVRIEVQSADWLKGLYSFYSQYSSYLKTSNRNKYLKIPPINGLILRSNKLSPLLSSAQIVNNSAPATDQLKQYVMFYVQVLYYEDYYHIRDILYNSGNYLITSFSLKRGDYPFKFYYYAGDQLTYESEVYIIDNNL